MNMDGDGSLWFLGILLLLIFVLFHGCMAAAEEALERRKSRVKTLQEDDAAARLLKNPHKLTIFFLTERACSGVAIALLTAQCFFWQLEPVLAERLGWNGWSAKALVLAVSFLTGSVVLATEDAVMRRIGGKAPEQTAVSMCHLVRVIGVCLLPIRLLVQGLEWLLGGWKADGSKEPTMTEEEFLRMVDAGNETGLLEESQKEMINNIIEFDDALISNVMTHRKEVVAVEVDTKISEVVYLAMNEGYSRMPVYKESIDNIIGVLMVKDLLALIGAEDVSRYRVRHFMRQALFVPEVAKCQTVLADMLHDKTQIAVAVDEYGGTAGIVTMEDLLEEIVGNIRDEYDDEEIEMRELTAGVFTIDGTADPEEALERLGTRLPEGQDFDTMSAFIVELLGRIPDEEETPVVLYGNVRFTVLLIEENWISKIKAEILPNIG